MNAKALKLLGAAALFAVALFVNASINTDRGSQDVKLADLANATEANAECYDKTYTNNGRCGMTGNCYALSTPVNCDSTANW